MISSLATVGVAQTQSVTPGEKVISVLNQFGVELRGMIHPGNKPEGQGTSGPASAAYAYDMGNLYTQYRQSSGLSPMQASSESTLFQAGLALKYGGGNCDHYSALGEFYLSRVIKPKLEMEGLATIESYERKSDLVAKHSFLEVKVAGVPGLIVFDPWAASSPDKALAGYASEYQFDVAGGRGEGAIAIDKWGMPDEFSIGDIDNVTQQLRQFTDTWETNLQQNRPNEYQDIKQRAESGNVVFTAYGNDTGFSQGMNAYAAGLHLGEGGSVSAWYRTPIAPPVLARQDSDESMKSHQSSNSDMSIT